MKADNPTKTGNFKKIDATQSSKWSLLYLSHQKNELTFELTNLKTMRVHKMIFAGTETSDAESIETGGAYPIAFETNYPVSFDNFHETFAFLTPIAGANGGTHLLRLGWIAAVEIHQPPGVKFQTRHLYGNTRIEYGSGERKKTGGICHGVTVLAWARVG